MRRVLVALSTLTALCCGQDRLVRKSCPETVMETRDETTTTTTTVTTTQSAFDIEQVSTLEAVDLIPGGADAVILDHDASVVPANAKWRVSAVDVLVMVPTASFAGYPASVGRSSVSLTVQAWDANTPVDPQRPAYQLTQTLDVNSLAWQAVSLSSGSYMRAWWTFNFAADSNPVIPETGMSSSQLLVGARWDSSGEPQLGYSNFNRPCERNWTDMGYGLWTLNSTLGGGGQCNWPMMRVSTEVLAPVTTTTTTPVTRPVTVMVERDECDPNAVDVLLDAGVGDAGVR